jgi:hypothetical protein
VYLDGAVPGAKAKELTVSKGVQEESSFMDYRTKWGRRRELPEKVMLSPQVGRHQLQVLIHP